MPLPDGWFIPKNREELDRLLRERLGLRVPREAVCPGHDAPLDYAAASFFRQNDLLVWANRGGGKTMLAAAATVLDAVLRGPLKACVLGGSFDQSDRLAEYIRSLLAPMPELVARQTRTKVTLAGGSEIRVLAQSQRAVRGLHVQKIRCDEVDLFDEAVWRAAQFSTASRDSSRGSIEVLSTLHRGGGLMDRLVGESLERAADNAAVPNAGYRLIRWCLWDVIERCPPSRECGSCPLEVDCRGIARRADGFYSIDDAITVHARSSRRAWEAEMLCRGAAGDDLVFPEFQPGLHVRPVECNPQWPIYRAIDFGYSSPLVCLWVQASPGGRVMVLDEYCRTRISMPAHAVEILRHRPWRIRATYVDPAGTHKESTSGAACTELLAAAGVPCTWQKSNIADGLELIRAALAPAGGEPTLTIAPKCTGLIAAFNGYHYEHAGGGRDGGRPAKDGPDHFIDALRYYFINRARPRKQVNQGKY